MMQKLEGFYKYILENGATVAGNLKTNQIKKINQATADLMALW